MVGVRVQVLITLSCVALAVLGWMPESSGGWVSCAPVPAIGVARYRRGERREGVCRGGGWRYVFGSWRVPVGRSLAVWGLWLVSGGRGPSWVVLLPWLLWLWQSGVRPPAQRRTKLIALLSVLIVAVMIGVVLMGIPNPTLFDQPLLSLKPTQTNTPMPTSTETPTNTPLPPSGTPPAPSTGTPMAQIIIVTATPIVPPAPNPPTLAQFRFNDLFEFGFYIIAQFHRENQDRTWFKVVTRLGALITVYVLGMMALILWAWPRQVLVFSRPWLVSIAARPLLITPGLGRWALFLGYRRRLLRDRPMLQQVSKEVYFGLPASFSNGQSVLPDEDGEILHTRISEALGPKACFGGGNRRRREKHPAGTVGCPGFNKTL